MGVAIENMRSCKVVRTAAVELTSGAATAISWQSALFNPNGLWEGVTNPTRITVDKPGMYLVSAVVQWEAGATGLRTIQIQKNGAANSFPLQASQAAPASGVGLQSLSGMIRLAASDYIELVATHTQGAGIDVAIGGASTDETPSLSIVLVAPEFDYSGASERP